MRGLQGEKIVGDPGGADRRRIFCGPYHRSPDRPAHEAHQVVRSLRLTATGGHRTLDGGKTWQKGLFNEEVRQFADRAALTRSRVYAGMCPVRLLRSEDGGTTWEPLDGLLDLPAEVQKKWDAPPVLRGPSTCTTRSGHLHSSRRCELDLRPTRARWRRVEPRSRKDVGRSQ